MRPGGGAWPTSQIREAAPAIKLLFGEMSQIVLTGVNMVSQNLAYLMRSGLPDSLDRMVAASYGTLAVQLLAEMRFRG